MRTHILRFLLITALVSLWQLSAAAQEQAIPLGTYVSIITQDDISDANLKSLAAEYELTLLPGGKYRISRNGFLVSVDNYANTAAQLELQQVDAGGGCPQGNNGTYNWTLTGARLTFTPVADKPDTCAWRQMFMTTKPWFRTEASDSFWQPLGLEGGTVQDFFTQGSRLFAATSGGIWVSDDNGTNWSQATGIAGYITYSMAEGAGYLLAGTNFGQIFRSTDNGQNWFFTNTDGIQTTVQALAVVGGNSYAGTYGNGVRRSTDGGLTWSSASAGLTSMNVYDLAVIGTDIFAATDGAGVFRSSDGGQNWAPVNTGLNRLAVRSLTVESNRIFAATIGSATIPSAIFVSEDNGQSWQQFGSALPVALGDAIYLISNLKVIGGQVFAATNNGLLFSNGGTWTRAVTGLPTRQFLGIGVIGNRVLAGSFGLGIIRSDDNGLNWSMSNTGLQANRILTIVASDNFICAGGEGGAFHSGDGGQTWTISNIVRSNGEKPLLNNLLLRGNSLYAGTNDGVYVSQNGGQDWARSDTGAFNLTGRFVYTLTASSTHLYAGTSGGVFVSTDGGQNWQAANSGLTNLIVASLVVSSTNIFAATSGGGVFISANNGQNWQAASTGLTNLRVFSLAAIGATLFAATETDGVFRSTDNGQSWTASNNGITRPFMSNITAVGNNLYASTASGDGSFRSTDQGQTWSSINAGLPARFAAQFSASNGKLYAGIQGRGVAVSRALVNTATTVSAASYAPALAQKSIVAAFGSALAGTTASANSLPLPTELAGTKVLIKDSNGVGRAAPLFFVSPGQINYQIPDATAPGTATVTVFSNDEAVSTGTLQTTSAAPAIFTTDQTGTGEAAALDALKFTGSPFDAKREGGAPNIIAIFFTGLGADATDVDADLSAEVTATIDGQSVTVLYAGRAPGFTGLNQMNLVLPDNITAGTHALVITRQGRSSNTVGLTIK